MHRMPRQLASVALLMGAAFALPACQTVSSESAGATESAAPTTAETPPNIVLIFVDDMGYADLGSYGSPVARTPNLDRLALEGQKWTSFYAPASVCTPSRAGLLTGRLAVRSGMAGLVHARHVLFPTSTGGLPQSEVTIAEMLGRKGYRSAALGKWHLGHLPEFLPTSQGFESYFGIPYSNDMNMPGGNETPWSVELFFEPPNIENWDVPLMDDEEIIERPANQPTLTKRYTERAIEFMQDSQKSGNPFFLYLAHNMPHTPLFTSDEFKGVSAGDAYGDVIEEIDWSVGEIVSALEEMDIADKTLVIFTSDNGPWLTMLTHSGSAGRLRDGKGTTWEGGMRVPAIFWWPGKVQPKTITGMGSALDLMPTFSAISGADMPADRTYDGVDLSSALFADADSPRDVIYYYRFTDVFAVRKGRYKAHFSTYGSFGGGGRHDLETPLLYDIEADPGEQFDIAADHPDIVAELKALADAQTASVEQVENQLELYPPGEKRGEDEKRPWTSEDEEPSSD